MLSFHLTQCVLVFLAFFVQVHSKEPCTIPGVPNGNAGFIKGNGSAFSQMNVGSSVEDGKIMVFFCRLGYLPLGQSQRMQVMITCMDGKWSDEPYCEPPQCYIHNIQFPGGLQKGSKEFYRHGETFEIVCDHPYQKSRESGRMRCEEGSWKGPMPPCLAECGRYASPQYEDGKVVDAAEGSWPWMVVILNKIGEKFYPWCGGVLIDSIHVLTAAHCFLSDKSVETYSALIGGVEEDEAEEYFIDSITKHEEYGKGGLRYNDLAILKLSVQVFPSFIPICLPDESVRNADLNGQMTTAIAWKASSTDNRTIVLQESWTGVMPKDYCQKHFNRNLGDGSLCTMPPVRKEKDCVVRDGEPLMLQVGGKWFVIGVGSDGRPRCRNQLALPWAYTSIYPYLDWIEKTIS